MNRHIVILAAGQGKRMHSSKPKVLHTLAGRPLLAHVIETAQALAPEAIHVIYGHEGERIKAAFADQKLNWIYQSEQLGTGHAVMQALPQIPAEAEVLILYADVPLIQPDTLRALLALEPQSLRLLLAELDEPAGLGRIIRGSSGDIKRIVEERDASEQERGIKEIYSGICCVSARDLHNWLPQLENNNSQKEYYLTEIIALAIRDKRPVHSLTVKKHYEIQGINDCLQLQNLERVWQLKQAEALLLAGVNLADAKRFDLRGTLRCGKDVFIDIDCLFIGDVVLEDFCTIEPHCVLKDVHLGPGTTVHANSVLEGCEIGADCQIGPFARLRTGTKLAAKCKIGNFVETKKAEFATGTKANHLSYLGDVILGKNVNIGAGTITCNYDGTNKHQTIIEDGAFIGSDTQLIAPVRIGENATIGAGSTIRKDAPPNELTLSMKKQTTVYGWKRPLKKE